MKREIDFVKLHAGWDEIIFIYGDQLPEGEEVDISLSILRKPSIRGVEVGILYPPAGPGNIRIKMVDDTTQGYILMCGGLTQAIGKAIVETQVGNHFGIRTSDGTNRVCLETDAGLIPIDIEVKNNSVQKVVTDMRPYVDTCYKRGVELVDMKGMSLASVGVEKKGMEFLALDADELSKQYPNLNFWKQEKAALDALEEIYRDFLRQKGLPLGYLYGTVYKMEKTEPAKKVRAVFRFFPWNYTSRDYLEYACGTGTVAIGIAMHERGQIDFQNGAVDLFLEIGGEHLPVDIRVRTQLTVEGTNQRVTGAWFSHDPVEVVASGKLYL